MLDSIRNKQFKFFIKDLKNLAPVSQNLLLVIQKMYFKNNIFLIKKDKKYFDDRKNVLDRNLTFLLHSGFYSIFEKPF